MVVFVLKEKCCCMKVELKVQGNILLINALCKLIMPQQRHIALVTPAQLLICSNQNLSRAVESWSRHQTLANGSSWTTRQRLWLATELWCCRPFTLRPSDMSFRPFTPRPRDTYPPTRRPRPSILRWRKRWYSSPTRHCEGHCPRGSEGRKPWW